MRNLVLEVLKGTFDAGTTCGSGVGDFKEGYTSGNLRNMVDKGILDMDDLVELWKSLAADPERPDRRSLQHQPDIKAKFKQFMVELPNTDTACFSAITGRRLQELSSKSTPTSTSRSSTPASRPSAADRPEPKALKRRSSRRRSSSGHRLRGMMTNATLCRTIHAGT